MKHLCMIVCCLFSMNSQAWWVDVHTAFTEVALQDLTPKTQHEINLLLHYPIVLSGSADLSNESSDLLHGSWADRIKKMKWQDPDSRVYYKGLHFMDVKGAVGDRVTITQARERMNNFLQHDAERKMNIVDGIQSLLKTIVSSDESMRDKAIALRLLLSLIGDIHEPMHILNLYINNKSTNGQTTIKLEPTIELTLFSGASEKVTNLHALWDASGGYIKDNSASSPAYIRYLQSMANEMIVKQHDNPEMIRRVSDPDLVHWAADSYQLGLDATEPQRIHLSASNGDVIGTMLNPYAYLDFVKTSCQQQLYLAGKHSALVLNALFDPEHTPKPYVAYLQKINNDAEVKTLKQMPPFQ